MTSLLHSPQEEFTLTSKELISTNNREKNLTELDLAATLETSSFLLLHNVYSPHALIGLLSVGCIALQLIMGETMKHNGRVATHLVSFLSLQVSCSSSSPVLAGPVPLTSLFILFLASHFLSGPTFYQSHMLIHPKSGWCWWYITANFLDFPPNFRLSTRNPLS